MSIPGRKSLEMEVIIEYSRNRQKKNSGWNEERREVV